MANPKSKIGHNKKNFLDKPDDVKKLLPWIDWAYQKVRSNYV